MLIQASSGARRARAGSHREASKGASRGGTSLGGMCARRRRARSGAAPHLRRGRAGAAARAARCGGEQGLEARGAWPQLRGRRAPGIGAAPLPGTAAAAAAAAIFNPGCWVRRGRGAAGAGPGGARIRAGASRRRPGRGAAGCALGWRVHRSSLSAPARPPHLNACGRPGAGARSLGAALPALNTRPSSSPRRPECLFGGGAQRRPAAAAYARGPRSQRLRHSFKSDPRAAAQAAAPPRPTRARSPRRGRGGGAARRVTACSAGCGCRGAPGSLR